MLRTNAGHSPGELKRHQGILFEDCGKSRRRAMFWSVETPTKEKKSYFLVGGDIDQGETKVLSTGFSKIIIYHSVTLRIKSGYA